MKIHINYFLKQYKVYLLLVVIIALGATLRFYKLDWGEGLFSHPDEYHIVGSVAQLSFPTQMHPHFFSYGTVTIYLIYFTQEILKHLFTTLNFQLLTFNSFLIGRFYSALFSSLTIFITYKICRTFMEAKLSLLAAFLVALTPGLIQQAHFATPESAQIFFLFSSLLFMMKLLQRNKFLYLVLASVFLGFSLGVKISSVVFLLPLIMAIIFRTYFKSFKPRHSGLSRISNHFGDSGCAAAYQNDAGGFRFFRKLFRLIILIFVSFIATITTFAIVAPYVFLDYSAFRSNLNYEGALAVGKIPVFYTRQFINTTPVLFQIEKILPYALGPVMLIMGILGLSFFVVFLIKNLVSKRHLGWWRSNDFDSSEVNAPEKILLLVATAFLSLFLSNAFLFAKWTRFIAPTFPFFAIFAVFSLQAFAKKTRRSVYYFLGGFLLISTIFWATAFFSIYTNHDIRITASKWLVSNAPSQSVIVIEGGNMIDIPLEGNFTRLGFDFYNFEENQEARTDIAKGLEKADYFLVQSRRVFYNHQRLRHLYPKTSRFYDALFDGNLGFEQIKEFHSYPKLSLFGFTVKFPDENAEETWSVFDHPVIRIFKKNTQLSKHDYEKIFEE